MLHAKLAMIEKQMPTRLEVIRIEHMHRGSIGSNTEGVLRDFLREYLPPHNRIGHGEVIDLHDSISSQLDVVITNEHHPYLNELTEPSLFFIEGVACAGEVKTSLNTAELGKALESALRFKSLNPDIPVGTQCRGNPEDLNRFVNSRPYFLFAFESAITLEKVRDEVNSFNTEKEVPIENQLDAIFVLDRGSIINFGAGNGALKYSVPGNPSLPGYNFLASKEAPKVLVNLLGWLSSTVPKISLPNSPLIKYLMKESPI